MVCHNAWRPDSLINRSPHTLHICSMIIGPRRNENGLLDILVDDSDITHVKSMKYLGLDRWHSNMEQLCKPVM